MLSKETLRRIDAFDASVDRSFDRLRGNPVADRIFYGASAMGDHGLIWFLLGALRGARSEHDWKAAVRVGVSLATEAAVVNLGIKSLFRRSRPVSDAPRPYHLRRPRTSSFPSGHATAGFTAATLLADGDRLGPAYYALAALVASSRVYVKIHHASDVVGGVVIGLGMGRLAGRLFPLAADPILKEGP
ncbi:MAG TPA: phosphatase PAP2 family protein [Acidimicrobiales bacterium]|nr:phosphatase PAP2 family protein [Acidimicrobiales bacterium]